MSTVTRNLSNIDGANVTNPDANSFTTNGLVAYANDAAFEAVTTPQAGSIYWNTTEKLLREYNGTSWQYDKLSVSTVTDSATTGPDQDITPSISDQIIRYTEGSLASIRSIAPTTQRVLWLINDQASSGITLKNEDVAATAANRIRTGNGQNFLLQTNQVVGLAYDDEISRWRIISRDIWGLEAFADDAAYVSAHGPVFTGSRYWNTTELVVREYDGTAWQNNKVLLSTGNDTTLTGVDQDVTPGRNQILKLSNASLSSIRGIIPSVQKFLIIVNGTGAAITVKDENGTATAANRIITGTGTDLSLSDKASILCAYDTNSSRWRVVGGTGTGSSSTSTDVNYFSDPGFEAGVDSTLPSGWLQYNDGAVAIPVDGTGGAANANVTMLVSTSGPIRGLKSAVITKGPGSQQGTGYSYLFTIANPDKGVTSGVDFELVTSASYATGDLVFYIYDVTNSVLITPRAVQLPALPNYGKFFSDYGLQTGTQYRFILHIASTNANAWTVTLDSMTNSTTRTAVPGGLAIYLGRDTSLTTANFGTISSVTVDYWQVGNILKARGRFTTGTLVAATASITLRNGLVADLGTATQIVGRFWNNTASATTRKAFPMVIGNGATALNITNDDYTTAADPGTALNASVVANSTNVVWFEYEVPVTGFSGVATVGAASVTQWASDDGTSDVLGTQGSPVPNVAFGTSTTSRVFSFSIPQDLRQFVRVEYNNQGFGWSSASDYYPFLAGNNSDANNFYGVRGYWSSTTQYTVEFGNQGSRVSASNASNGAASWATRFAAGDRYRVGLSIGGVFIGINMVNATQSGFARAYNDLAKIRLNTTNGFGSINTAIRRFTNVVVNTGTGITYADSATAGATFTCTEQGVYQFTYTDGFNAAAVFGLSLNSNQLATAIQLITAADVLVMAVTPTADFHSCVSTTIALAVGDVVRPHASAAEGTAAGRGRFSVQRVS